MAGGPDRLRLVWDLPLAVRAYALLATAMGWCWGLFLVTGNLLAPIVTHALYDFLALLYLVRRTR